MIPYKTFSLLFTAAITSLFMSCDDKGADVRPEVPEALIGSWHSTLILINDENSEAYNPNMNSANWLLLREGGFYAYNYYSGDYIVSENSLQLTQKPNAVGLDRTYRILELTDDKLVIEASMTDVAYGFDLEEFGPEEVLTFTETFEKQPD